MDEAERQLREKVLKDFIAGRIFFCDPDKNEDCPKTMCYRNGGDCFLTKHEQFKV